MRVPPNFETHPAAPAFLLFACPQRYNIPFEGSNMPIYEYACKQCGHEFEALVRSSTIPDCPSCHSIELDKKLSVFSSPSSSAQSAAFTDSPCGSCGHPGGPGSCGMQGMH
jgi:putative FmdB family regulatory protein